MLGDHDLFSVVILQLLLDVSDFMSPFPSSFFGSLTSYNVKVEQRVQDNFDISKNSALVQSGMEIKRATFLLLSKLVKPIL